MVVGHTTSTMPYKETGRAQRCLLGLLGKISAFMQFITGLILGFWEFPLLTVNLKEP